MSPPASFSAQTANPFAVMTSKMQKRRKEKKRIHKIARVNSVVLLCYVLGSYVPLYARSS